MSIWSDVKDFVEFVTAKPKDLMPSNWQVVPNGSGHSDNVGNDKDLNEQATGEHGKAHAAEVRARAEAYKQQHQPEVVVPKVPNMMGGQISK